MRRFNSLLGTELRKALGSNPWFWLSVAVGVSLALYCAYTSSIMFANTFELVMQNWEYSDELYSTLSCFALWMPVDTTELGSGILILTWPLLAALPYAWAWSVERRCGALEQQVVRASRVACWGAKLSAAFVSGALVVAVPYVVNLMACACFAPASLVWVTDVIYVGVGPDAPLSGLFYTSPLVFCVAWTLVAALVAGLWSAFVAALSAHLGRSVEVLIGSYVVLHILAYVGGQVRAFMAWTPEGSPTRSALLSFDLFSVIGVRTQEGATAALLLTVALLGAMVALSLWVLPRRDVLR